MNEDLAHHVLQTDDHDVQQVQLLGHPQGQTFVGEELHAHVDHTVTKSVRVHGPLQHHRDPAVVQHKSSCQRLLHKEQSNLASLA